MPELLITYAVTASVFDAFRNTLDLQKHFQPVHPTGWTVRSIVVTNDRIPDYWDGESLVDARIGDARSLCFSRLRNLCCDYATRSNADWLVMLDADSIWLGVTQFPVTGYTTVPVFFTRPDEAIDALPISDPARWINASWWLMSRPVFSNPKLRHDEQFIGHSYNDWDFMEHVLKPNGIFHSPSDARALHVWHPDRYHPDDNLRNASIYAAKHAAFITGSVDSTPAIR